MAKCLERRPRGMSFQSPNKSRKAASTAILKETWVAQSCGICKSSLVLTTAQHPNFPDAWLKLWKLNTSKQSGSMQVSVKAPEMDSCPTGGAFFHLPSARSAEAGSGSLTHSPLRRRHSKGATAANKTRVLGLRA